MIIVKAIADAKILLVGLAVAGTLVAVQLATMPLTNISYNQLPNL